MYAARDKFGTYLISEGLPERMRAHWRAPDHRYMVMNSKFGEEVFPDLQWKDEPREISGIVGF